jgi:hypothetical protein
MSLKNISRMPLIALIVTSCALFLLRSEAVYSDNAFSQALSVQPMDRALHAYADVSADAGGTVEEAESQEKASNELVKGNREATNGGEVSTALRAATVNECLVEKKLKEKMRSFLQFPAHLDPKSNAGLAEKLKEHHLVLEEKTRHDVNIAAILCNEFSAIYWDPQDEGVISENEAAIIKAAIELKAAATEEDRGDWLSALQRFKGYDELIAAYTARRDILRSNLTYKELSDRLSQLNGELYEYFEEIKKFESTLDYEKVRKTVGRIADAYANPRYGVVLLGCGSGNQTLQIKTSADRNITDITDVIIDDVLAAINLDDLR